MALRGYASNSNTAGSASVTVTVSSIGIQNGDLILLMAQCGGGTSGITFTYPTGFTAITGLPNQAQGTQTEQSIAFKFATAGEPSSYTVGNSVSNFETVHCRVYSGRNVMAPFTAVAPKATTTTGNTPVALTAAAVTSAAGDDVVVFMANLFYNGTYPPTFTPNSTWGNAVTTFANVKYSPIITVCDNLNVAAGSSATAVGTYAVSSGTGLTYAAMTLSLAAANVTPATQLPVPSWAKQTFVNEIIQQF